MSSKHSPKSSQGSVSSEGDIFFEATTEIEVINEHENEERTFNDNNNNDNKNNNNIYLKNKNSDIWQQYHKNNGSSSRVIRHYPSSSLDSTTTAYMTPQGSTSNLLINTMRQSVQSIINQSHNNQSEIDLSTTASSPFITSPSSPFDTNKLTMDFNNYNIYNNNNNNIGNNGNGNNSNNNVKSININNPYNYSSSNSAAVTAKVREYESLIKRSSHSNLNPIIESEIKTVESSYSSKPKYNHTVQPSSGSNTYVGEPYDHIEIENNNDNNNDDDDTNNNLHEENLLNKEAVLKSKSSVKPNNSKKITGEGSSSNIDVEYINKDDSTKKNRNRPIKSSRHNRNNSSKEIIIEEEDYSVKNSKRISKLSFITTKGGDTTTSRSESTIEIGVIDSPISQKHLTTTNDFTTAFSPTTSFNQISRESIRTKNVIRLKIWENFLLMIGCCLILFLAILDINLIANQLPKILEEFKAGEEFSWLINSHSLTSTMLQPFCRKLSTIFGKKLTFLVSILIFGASSVLCGASQNIQWLIATRATMGIGSGMIASMTFIIISEVLPYKQKVFYNIVMNIIFAIAFIVGPLLGGLFVDYVSWRWSFYMNGPLSIICIIILLIALRKFGKSSENTSTKLKEVDWLGIFLLASGLLLLLFGLNYGGNKFPWISVTILTIFGVGFVILVFFGIFEKIFVKKPLIPTSMFKDSSIRAIFGCFYFIGWIQVIVIYYTPIYFQYVRLQSATQSGISILPLVSSVVIFCAISGTLIIKFEKYKWLLYIGSISLIGGGFLLSTFNLTTETLLRVIALIVIGCGIGTQFILLIPALRAVKKGEKSGMIGLCNFFRGYGFIFGISISTALFNNHILSNMKNTQNYPIKSSLNDALSLKNIRQLDEEQKNIILNSINNGISTNYILCIFVAVMGLIFASFIKNYNLKNDKKGNEIVTEDNNNNSNDNNFEVLNEKIT